MHPRGWHVVFQLLEVRAITTGYPWAFLEHPVHTVCCKELDVLADGVVIRITLHRVAEIL